MAQGSPVAPVVFVNRRSPLQLARPFVGIDNFQAGKEVGLYFDSKSFTDYLIFHTPLTSSAVYDRVNGLIAGMAGVKPRDSITVRSHTKEEAYAAATKYLGRAHPPQAIFCSTDEIAYGVARRCVEIDLLPQRDVMIFGFDGNPLNPYIAPWLGTVEIPYDDFGEVICDFFDRHHATQRRSLSNEYLFPYTVVRPSEMPSWIVAGSVKLAEELQSDRHPSGPPVHGGRKPGQ